MVERLSMADEQNYDLGFKKERKCKHFHADPYWTPNNFDLYFNYTDIPSNIQVDSSVDLIRRLKKHLPLSKILHINMESENIQYMGEFNIYTQTKISFKRDNGNIVEDVVVNLK